MAGRRRARTRRAAGVAPALAALSLLVTVSCAHRSPSSGAPSPPGPVWPPPPAAARIEYLDSFRVPRDLGIRRGAVTRFLARLFRGRRARALARPYAIAVAPDGRIAVADPDARSLHVFDPGHKRYHRLTRAGGRPLESPVGVAFDPEGRFYVADSARGAVFRSGEQARNLDRFVREGELRRPTGLAFDLGRGLLWVVDTLGHRVVGFDEEGRRKAVLGGRGTGDGRFNYPVAVTVGPGGRLYVTDSMNFRVQILDPERGFVASFGSAGTGPGDLDKAKGIALDRDGHVYVVEGLHDVVQVYDGGGRLLTVIGGTGTGPGQFWLPTGIHIDASGRIFIADSANHRVQILRYLGEAAGAS
ncbi:MAG: 6-bladed beta-propeller [Acidobacteriota bacterium]